MFQKFRNSKSFKAILLTFSKCLLAMFSLEIRKLEFFQKSGRSTFWTFSQFYCGFRLISRRLVCQLCLLYRSGTKLCFATVYNFVTKNWDTEYLLQFIVWSYFLFAAAQQLHSDKIQRTSSLPSRLHRHNVVQSLSTKQKSFWSDSFQQSTYRVPSTQRESGTHATQQKRPQIIPQVLKTQVSDELPAQ